MSHLQFIAILGLLMEMSGTMVVYRYTEVRGKESFALKGGISRAALFTVVTNTAYSIVGSGLLIYAFVKWAF